MQADHSIASSSTLALHHVGYAVKTLDQIANLYVRRFGFQILTPPIHVPSQTAIVQFLRLNESSVFLEFIAADGPQSKLVNAVKKGGGLNHLCYASGPLEIEIARLEKENMTLIVAPAPSEAFAGRRVCWLIGEDPVPVELVERRTESDLCTPG